MPDNLGPLAEEILAELLLWPSVTLGWLMDRYGDRAPIAVGYLKRQYPGIVVTDLCAAGPARVRLDRDEFSRRLREIPPL